MSAPTLPASSAAQQAMQTLTAQWYNAVVTGCGLDPATFQLCQGVQPLGTTSEQLWNVFDAVPPTSVSHYWNPAQISNFSSIYGGVINNLVPQNSGTFMQLMGDYYSQWQAYLHSTPPPTIPAGGILALFQQWQALNMPPAQGQAAYTAYQEVAQGVVPVAVQLWIQAGGGAGGVKAYNQTIADLNALITPATPGKSVHMNSETASSDVSHSWAKGDVVGVFDFFEGGGEASYDQLTTQVASAGVEIDATFAHLVTFSAGPLAKPSSDPILGKYSPWYDSQALDLAYSHDDYFTWQQTPPAWADVFGPDGELKQLTTSLVVVSGVSVTVTSEAAFSQSQQTDVRTAVEAGFFPFFGVEASGGWSHDVEFSDTGALTVTSTVPEGLAVVLGAIVTPISSFLGG